ncbi:BEL1-like homeodomain protein [Striga asiatica]|uniref:BEL1-like homeodomain protein n=1 Tax=Striga asiatica TaxID=4170 RepID=A0A5A7RF99_STRAF|nr:BEL1-like homeodomain protein [Striga asiatica]
MVHSRFLLFFSKVYKRYKQYYQQMQAAVAAFESVAGLSSAAPFANLSLKAMSKHFTYLKNAITDQLSKSHSSDRDESTQRLENSGKSSAYCTRPFHGGAGFVDPPPPVWRPQRGLPEHAVTVLRAWLFEHFLHPYPTDTDKLMLAKQTGLSRNQVSNWFINARVRLWKPMVEEIHTLETRQQGQNSSSSKSEQSPNKSNNEHTPTTRPIEFDSPYPPGFPSKRTREDPTNNTPRQKNHGPVILPYDSFMPNNNNINNNHNNHLHAGMGSGGVSLTLGLHQNGLGLPDSYPINAARRFGLDLQPGEEYVAHNRQFGREVLDGQQQIVHDFVG